MKKERKLKEELQLLVEEKKSEITSLKAKCVMNEQRLRLAEDKNKEYQEQSERYYKIEYTNKNLVNEMEQQVKAIEELNAQLKENAETIKKQESTINDIKMENVEQMSRHSNEKLKVMK